LNKGTLSETLIFGSVLETAKKDDLMGQSIGLIFVTRVTIFNS